MTKTKQNPFKGLILAPYISKPMFESEKKQNNLLSYRAKDIMIVQYSLSFLRDSVWELLFSFKMQKLPLLILCPVQILDETEAFFIIKDHISLWIKNPLIGRQLPSEISQFQDMDALYDPTLSKALNDILKNSKFPIYTGTLLAFSDFPYSSRAGLVAAQNLGADAIGLAPVPEAIAAYVLGFRVFSLGLTKTLPPPSLELLRKIFLI